MKVPWSTIALLWAIYLGVWVLHGLGAGVFVKGVMAIPLDRVPVMASYYALAWLVAMVSVVAPAGMGIRDGVLGLLLSQLMPVGVAFTVAVAVRLWMTVLELFWRPWLGTPSARFPQSRRRSARAPGCEPPRDCPKRRAQTLRFINDLREARGLYPRVFSQTHPPVVDLVGALGDRQIPIPPTLPVGVGPFPRLSRTDL